MNQDTFPKFITDKPLGKDLLEGGSHDKIAQSITQYINSDYSDRKLIGIDGAWGSGKSNVIEILRSRYLIESHHIFIFDAWGHQEDLQRRAILEELTGNLIENNILPTKTKIQSGKKKEEEKDWNDLLKNLISRKRETNTTIIPHLNKGIILIITALLLTPIFKSIGETVRVCNLLSIMITALPAIVCFSWLIVLIKIGKIKMAEIYAIYKGKELENTVYETISEGEPNVSEFRGWMKHLSTDLGKNNKKLIIVFDNMDRLLPEKVKALWSSIHTFFAECSYPNIWVIIPFDRDHIKDAFGENNGSEEKSTHFIDKTFTAIFRITPPILSDWHNFFEIKFGEAFGNSEDSEYNLVKSTFDLTHRNITPRNIITFINSIVSEKRLVGCEVKLRYIAVFSIFKKEVLANPIDEILKPSFLNKIENLYRGDTNLSDSIASLVYNLPIESARQITLILDLKNTLNEKNIDRINEYANQKHFIEMLEKVIDQEEINIENAILTISAIDQNLIKSFDIGKLSLIWSVLCLKQQIQPLVQQEFTEPCRILLSNISSVDKLTLVKYIVREIENFKEFSGKKYYLALSDTIDFISNSNMKIDVFSMLNPIEKDPATFLDFLKFAGNEYSAYKLLCNEPQLLLFVNEKVPNNLNEFDHIQFISDTFKFDSVIDKIEKCIGNEEVTIDNVSNLFSFYKVITDKRPLKFLTDEQIYTLIESAQTDSTAFFELLAMRLAKGSLFDPNYNTGVSQSFLQKTDVTLISELSGRIESYKDLDDLIVEVIDWPKPLLKAVLKKIISEGDSVSSVIITNILPKFNEIHELLKIDYSILLQFFIKWDEEMKESINRENISEIIPDVEFFECAVTDDNDITNFLLETLSQHLQIISVKNWEESLIDNTSYNMRALFCVLQNGHVESFPDNSITAFKNLLVRISKSETPPITKVDLDLILSKINKNALKPTIKNIRDHFINNYDITPELFKFFAGLFYEHGKLEERYADVTRRILTPVIEDDTCLSLIIQKTNYFAEIVNNASDDAENFRDIIRQKIESGLNIENLVEFGKEINVRIINENDSENS